MLSLKEKNKSKTLWVYSICTSTMMLTIAKKGRTHESIHLYSSYPTHKEVEGYDSDSTHSQSQHLGSRYRWISVHSRPDLVKIESCKLTTTT